MPKGRGDKNLREAAISHAESFAKSAVLVGASSTGSAAKATATDENLLSIHKKIQMHLQGSKILSSFEVRRLALILNRMECPSFREQKILETAQNILVRIYEQITQNSLNPSTIISPKERLKSPFELSTSGQDDADATLNALNEESVSMTMNESIPFHSQTANVLKLRLHRLPNEDDGGQNSFPLELLTNDNFTLRSTDSGLMGESIHLPSNFTSLELNTQNRNTLSISNKNMLNEVTNNNNSQLTLTQLDESIQPNSDSVEMELEDAVQNNIRTSKNIRIDANAQNLFSTSPYFFDTKSRESILDNPASVLDIQESFGLPQNMNPIWKKPIVPNHQSMTIKSKLQLDSVSTSNSERLLDFQTMSSNVDPQISNAQGNYNLPLPHHEVESRFLNFKFPSEGSNWKEANITISQATEYNADESDLTEIISLSQDNIVIDEGIEMTNSEAEFLELAANTPNIVINKTQSPEIIVPENIETDDGSLVFNLGSANSTNTVIEATPLANLKRVSENNKMELLMDNPRKKRLSQMSVISETEDIIIEETEYFNSEPYLSNTQRHGGSSPYKNQTQSNSFLSFKSNSKSPSLLKQDSNGSHLVSKETTQEQVQSENVVHNNGAIPKKYNQTDNTPIAEEVSFQEKQKMLQEKIIKKRNMYQDKWKDMPVSQKVSAKFADKFHVNIFEDPVESLLNINYKPNFNNFHFPRLTTKEMHEQLKPSSDQAEILDSALTKVVGELAKENNSASNLLKSPTSNTDSDSSDDENKANKKWLKEYFAKTKHETKEFMEQMYKAEREAEESSRRLRASRLLEDNKDTDEDEPIEELLKKLGECNWLNKEQTTC